MAKVPAYARYLYQLNQTRKDAQDPEFDGCEDALAFIAVKESEDERVKITDLVQSLQFGTGPTVHRKVTVLMQRGFIKIVTSKTDGRAKDLTLTTAGMDLLKDRSRLLKQCVEA